MSTTIERAPQTLAPLANAVLLPRDSIYPNPNQPREYFNEEEIANLRESIREHGVLQPLVVRYEPSRYDGTPYILTAGERRFRASEGVLEALPCIIKDVSPKKARAMAFEENAQRRDLTAAEEAAYVRELMESDGLTIREVAARLHKSQGWVSNRLSYLKTGADVRAVGERVVKAMSSLLLADKLKAPAQRAELLHGIEHEFLPHAQVKMRVESLLETQASQQRADEFKRRASKAPDSQTASRLSAESKGKASGMSRGQRVTGGKSRGEANQEVMRALGNLEAWIPHCDPETHKKAQILARRILREDLAR